ncbi:hypothetical protein DICSQDRAFT_100439 [Dichomitus squalens LYAD-421 SS1]|uniref:uncharacterized protein n=1 Tax=Dichomitus squalens (strain LYAD-421) TaxID=732165 RepID=UPI0004415231|nr:uncharacterized protein DICSQDRAFT_100439 [Dichomitus squalens LYAD-421 SS1]EJF64941.1 hypothetical protein DICSQDRAFT_100439 [Dichomitus squalens LYAD-421 SS1]
MNSESKFTEGLPPASRSHHDLPGAFGDDEDHLQLNQNQDHNEDGGADVKRKPFIAVPRDPIIKKAPADGDEEEEPEYEPEQHNRSHRRASSAGVTTDSGYVSGGAGGLAKRSHSRASASQGSIAPIPVLWTDSPSARDRSLADHDGERPSRASPFRRASSLRSFHTSTVGERERDERGSIRTAPSIGGSPGVRRRRTSLIQGSFASGAGTVGPSATPHFDETFHSRSQSADAGLSERQRVKLSKSQLKEGKKVAKIIKAEGKAEQKAIDEALRELADLQKMQKAAVKEESKAYAAYSKVLKEFRKTELEFFAARAKYERAQADLQAQEDAREASRAHARETTEMLQEKNREVEWLRAQKAVDDRERQAKVRQLTGK